MHTKNKPFAFLRGNIAFRLWGAMMILAGIGVIFLWFVQIALFEPNYVDASMATMISNAEPLAEELSALSAGDSSGASGLLRSFSKSTNARVYLADQNGDILLSYINGKLGITYDTVETQKEMQYILQDLPAVLGGEISKQVITPEKLNMSLAIGVPAIFQGNQAAIFVHQSLAAMETLQALNRNQLVLLSVVMALMASVIAVFLTRNFTKPIHDIENTVKRLAEGDLAAKPDVRRSDELGRLSRSVEELGVALQRVDVLRKEVIANVSHELSAPLSLILGYSEKVRDITGDDPAERNKDMDLIIRETSRLSQMVDEIMDYSKFQSGYGKLNIEDANLYDLIATEIVAIRQTAEEYGIKIELGSFSLEIPVNVDPLKMSQVIRNLLNNAINHTADSGIISVTLARDGDSMVRVNIRNPGKPIPAEEQEVIWERYQRVQHQGGRREGSGIGLSIVSTILEAHGMQYGVESGAGSNTFWFCVLTA